MSEKNGTGTSIDLTKVSGHWFLQHVYQMRDVDQIPLKGTTEQAARSEAEELLKKYPNLDEPCLLFKSLDGSLRYQIDLRKNR